ncbi:MAG: cation transporter [Patescibacteria group bacterium]|nr:cation transporter [Patescibacteria group bacterium]
MNKKLIFIAIPLVLVGIIGFRLITNNPSGNSTQAFDMNSLRHVAMKIDDMYCASCPYNVENALKDTSGVVNVTVGFVGKEIINGTVEGRGEVIYDSTKINLDKMIQTILPYKGVVLDDQATTSTELAPLSKTFGL